MFDATDNRVLSQLMLLQGTLDSMPTDESISRFVSRGLKSVPGVSSLNVCIRGAVAEKNDRCASCNYQWGEAEDNFDYLCKLEDHGNTRCLPIRTVDHLYGFVVFSLNDAPDAFTPYEPYLQNIVNVIAISIDNRRQRQLLEVFNKRLQGEVEHRKQTAEALQESEELYHSLFENMLDGFAYCKMLYDEEGRPVDFVYLDVNTAFKQLTGLKDVAGKKVTEVIPEIKELSPELFEGYGRVALTGNPEKFEIDFKSLAKCLSISVYSTKKGYFVAVFDDITERKRYEKKLEHFAIHDQLTGLLNRHALGDILSRTIAKAKRGAVSSILYMDLDNFKDVNDSIGHSAGDEVLITLAGLLKDALRTEDIVFRLGGDEFAVLLDGMTGRDSLPAAERLRANVEAHRFELEGRVFPLSLSIGLIEIDGIVATGELLSQADAAMYLAKAQGKNRVVVA